MKFTIKVPLYQFDCVVVIDDHIEKLVNAQLKKADMELLSDDEELNGYALNAGNNKKYFLFYHLQALTPNVITHEISHIVDYVFSDRDISKDEAEGRAYLTGYISEKVFDYALKHRILISKWLKSSQIETVDNGNSKEE